TPQPRHRLTSQRSHAEDGRLTPRTGGPIFDRRNGSTFERRRQLNTQRWDTREDLRLAIVTWIETKYNRRRRQRALGKLTPIEFEMIYTTAEAA
ncbi:IS3 family transposase, partial [Nocardioides bruguierae]|uniref:IS3 family transposase n=1 Tax=Nocardioides bruguierae TaxID=2945102 RepID=UPI0020215277